MQQTGPSSDLLMLQALLFWILSWWLAVLGDGHPIWVAVSALHAFVAMGLAIASATHAVRAPSPWPSVPGRMLWALRPRKWMIAWGLIITLFAVLGRPMILNNYGGGRCQYIDWWAEARWYPAPGDGRFGGCRAFKAR